MLFRKTTIGMSPRGRNLPDVPAFGTSEAGVLKESRCGRRYTSHDARVEPGL